MTAKPLNILYLSSFGDDTRGGQQNVWDHETEQQDIGPSVVEDRDADPVCNRNCQQVAESPNN